MQLDLNSLTDHPVYISGFGGQNFGVLELDAMFPADAVFGTAHTTVFTTVLYCGRLNVAVSRLQKTQCTSTQGRTR
jgi:hypothetical protein